MKQEQINQIVGALLVACYKVLHEHLAEPHPTEWEAVIHEPVGVYDGDRAVGRYADEYQAISAVIAELNRLYPDQWEVNSTGQFVGKASRGGDPTWAHVRGIKGG